MKEKYLPLGTRVLLKNATKELMIIGYCGIDFKGGKLFDYSGVVYPEGYLGSSFNLLFDHSQIDKIINEGSSDEKWQSFINELKKKNGNKTNEELYKEYDEKLDLAIEKIDKEIKTSTSEPTTEDNDSNDTFGEGVQ